MFIYLLLLFTVVPFLELALLLKIHSYLGLLPTLALVFGTGILGAALARWQGMHTLQQIRQQLSAGKVPGEALLDGLLILIAGAVLLTPGVLTDLCGFALLVPPLRKLFKRFVKSSFQRRVHIQTVHFSQQSHTGQFHNGGGPAGDVIVEGKVLDSRVVQQDVVREDEDRSG